MPNPSNDPTYTLTIDGFSDDEFHVRRFVGREKLSESYAFDVDVSTEQGFEEGVEESVLGQRVTFTWSYGQGQRAFYGIVASARLIGGHEILALRSAVLRLRVVPRLWLLKRKKRSRIFQHMRVPEVVTAVLAEAGIAVRWHLFRDYPQQAYCTQYEETDEHFVRRLLGEAGIFFHFAVGPRVDSAALASAQVIGAGAAIAGGVLGSVAGGAAGAIAEAAVAAVAPLIPGDTLICADDATFYPDLGRDAAVDAGALVSAAVDAAADAAGLGGAIGGAVGTAAGVVAGAITAATSGAAPSLYYRGARGMVAANLDAVTAFELGHRVRSTLATFRDYDPGRPLLRLNSIAAAGAGGAIAEGIAIVANAAVSTLGGVTSVAATPIGQMSAAIGAGASAALGAAAPSAALEIYEHGGPFLFPKWSVVREEAARMLRQSRRDASVATGRSLCPSVAPGHRFELREHPFSRIDGTYAVTSVVHRGQAPRGDAHESREDAARYANEIECVPASVTFIPKRPKRHRAQVALTATVVGPAGEEIHVDPMGQIRVQFHWDREGRRDERSSCWIRTAQALAGAGWGAQFIPRVGMEVLVVFEDGDPDKPLVTGCVYNGTHPTPFRLPSDRTRSGWRTQSSPGGGGFNELSFEDAAGKEQVYLHAERDLDEKVGHNHTLLVRHDEVLHVLGSRLDTIEKHFESLVRGDHFSRVEGNRKDMVCGNVDAHVSGARVNHVEGRDRSTLKDDSNFEYASDLTTEVRGCMTTLVGRADRKRSWVTHAEGTAALSALDKLELVSDKELVIRVGKSSIRITEDKIEIASKAITAKGAAASLSASEDGFALSSKGDATMKVKKTLKMQTEMAEISLDHDVTIKGTSIAMKMQEPSSDSESTKDDPPTKVELKDDAGGSLPYQRFLIVLDDKSEVSGMTDKDGKAELDLASGGKIQFPGVTMPADPGTKGPVVPYVVRQGDYLDKLAFAHGFDADEVWNDAKNAELKKKRKSPNLLHPGDVVQFARVTKNGVPLSKGTTNSYEAKVPKTKVHLAFKDEQGPFAGEAYAIDGLGPVPVTGTSGGDGAVVVEVPIHVRELRVTFPKRGMTFPVAVGEMDPIDEPMGIRKRLENLGLLIPASGAETEAEADTRQRRAVVAFQKAHKLPETGVVDDATRKALEDAHDGK